MFFAALISGLKDIFFIGTSSGEVYKVQNRTSVVVFTKREYLNPIQSSDGVRDLGLDWLNDRLYILIGNQVCSRNKNLNAANSALLLCLLIDKAKSFVFFSLYCKYRKSRPSRPPLLRVEIKSRRN